MKNVILTILICGIFSLAAFAQPPTHGYYLFFGNPDGSPVGVIIDSEIAIEVWAATPAIGSGDEDLDGNGVVDSLIYMYTPLASDDSFIVLRNGGEAYDPLSPGCASFMNAEPNSPPGYTTQGFLYLDDSYNCVSLNTGGDTLHIADFYMHTSNDTSLIGQTVCPFIETNSPTGGGVLWGMQDGITPIIPAQNFSCMFFVNYMAGDANGSGRADGVDAIYLAAYFKGYGPPPDPMLAGDANGDCITNLTDISYLINYCKGGPEPFPGNCN